MSANAPFRIIRGEGGNFKTIYYWTKESRDRRAQRWADLDGTLVITELWSRDHPQDDLNRGWACDGAVHPKGSN